MPRGTYLCRARHANMARVQRVEAPTNLCGKRASCQKKYVPRLCVCAHAWQWASGRVCVCGYHTRPCSHSGRTHAPRCCPAAAARRAVQSMCTAPPAPRARRARKATRCPHPQEALEHLPQRQQQQQQCTPAAAAAAVTTSLTLPHAPPPHQARTAACGRRPPPARQPRRRALARCNHAALCVILLLHLRSPRPLTSLAARRHPAPAAPQKHRAAAARSSRKPLPLPAR